MRLASLVLALLLAPAAARAGSPSAPDYSDLWWKADESGWGAHVTLQDDVVFMVLYVYDADRQPRFFVAPDMPRAGSASVHEGALYRTRGPAFAGPFDPARVSAEQVGTARLAFASPTEAVLEYTVGGAQVRKSLTRQSWRAPNLEGDYMGGLFGTATANTCPLGLPSLAYPGALRVAQQGDQVTIDMVFAPGFSESGACRLAGRLLPQGSLASIAGTFECTFTETHPTAGTFELAAIESGENGFGGRYTALEGAACRHSGYLGGIRRGYGSLLPPPPDPEPDPPDD